MNEAPLLRAESVTVRFDGQTALDSATLEIYRRDYIGIVGPNGGGKTTLIRVLLGLQPADSGRVEWPCGRVPVGYVSQSLSRDVQFPVTVRDTVLMGTLTGTSWGVRYSAREQKRAEELMERLSLGRLAKRGMGDLSGGERQRAFLARALMSDPAILVLDEPTASIDPEMRGTVYGLLEELNRQMAIVLITHDTEGLRGRVGRLLYLDRRIQEPADTATIFAERRAASL